MFDAGKYTEKIKKVRQDFYEKKLLNQDFIFTLFTNVRRDINDLKLPTDYLYLSTDCAPIVN